MFSVGVYGDPFLSDPEDYDGAVLTIEDTFATHGAQLRAGRRVVYPSSSVHAVTPVPRVARSSRGESRSDRTTRSMSAGTRLRRVKRYARSTFIQALESFRQKIDQRAYRWQQVTRGRQHRMDHFRLRRP